MTIFLYFYSVTILYNTSDYGKRNNKKVFRLRNTARRARVASATYFFPRECASKAERFLFNRKFGGISY